MRPVPPNARLVAIVSVSATQLLLIRGYMHGERRFGSVDIKIVFFPKSYEFLGLD